MNECGMILAIIDVDITHMIKWDKIILPLK